MANYSVFHIFHIFQYIYKSDKDLIYNSGIYLRLIS